MVDPPWAAAGSRGECAADPRRRWTSRCRPAGVRQPSGGAAPRTTGRPRALARGRPGVVQGPPPRHGRDRVTLDTSHLNRFSDHVPRPTINDVATAAGVSKGAVSFALNDRPGLAPETRQRILDVAAELGWSPSARARGAVGVAGLRGGPGGGPTRRRPAGRRVLPGVHRRARGGAVDPRPRAAAAGRRGGRRGDLPPAGARGTRRRRLPHRPPGGRPATGAARVPRPAGRGDRAGPRRRRPGRPAGPGRGRRPGHHGGGAAPAGARAHPHRARLGAAEHGARPLASPGLVLDPGRGRAAGGRLRRGRLLGRVRCRRHPGPARAARPRRPPSSTPTT